MKQLEELEEKFLNEVKPLVDGFIQYKNQENPSIMQKVESVDIRKAISSKVSEFITTYRETANKETEIKTQEIEKQKQELSDEGKNLIQLKTQILKRKTAMEEVKEKGDMKTYQLLYLTQVEESQKFKKMKQEYDEKKKLYKSSIQQIDELKEAQTKFEEKYGDMDYITEREVYRLYSYIDLEGSKEPELSHDRQAYDENGNLMENIESTINMGERVEEKRAQEFEETKKRIAQEVLAQKKKEYDEYINARIQEFEDLIKEEENRQNEPKVVEKKDKPKKQKISLWQRFTSIFRKRDIPLLEEGKQPIKESSNKSLKKELTEGVPTEEQQSKHAKWFFNRNKEKDAKTKDSQEELDDVLTILD